MDQRLQVANLFLCGRRFLELRGRGFIWLHDQSSDRSLLCAGTKPHPGTRTHRPLRRIRHAWPRADAVLPASAAAWTDVERSPARHCVLVHQHRSCSDGLTQYVADRSRASVGICRGRDLVCAFVRISPYTDTDESPMDADVR